MSFSIYHGLVAGGGPWQEHDDIWHTEIGRRSSVTNGNNEAETVGGAETWDLQWLLQTGGETSRNGRLTDSVRNGPNPGVHEFSTFQRDRP